MSLTREQIAELDNFIDYEEYEDNHLLINYVNRLILEARLEQISREHDHYHGEGCGCLPKSWQEIHGELEKVKHGDE